MTDVEIRRGGDPQTLTMRLEHPFESTLPDGTPFKIGRIVVKRLNTIIKQIDTGQRMEVKFCLSELKPVKPNPEQVGEKWAMIIFPMYVGNQEILHGDVVDYQDSAINGNVVIKKGRVVESTSNHPPEDEEISEYARLVTPVLLFAEDMVQDLLDNDFNRTDN